MYVQHTAYGSDLTPTPYSHYVDDVTVFSRPHALCAVSAIRYVTCQ